jgi:hypothetical protein
LARLRFLAHAAAAVTVAAGLTTAVFTGSASACSCYPGDTEQQRHERATHVFAGVVQSRNIEYGSNPRETYDDKSRYTVKVGQQYKGGVPATVDVLTPYQVSACGITLTVGVDYLVFASGDSSDGRVESYTCSGTRLASGGPPTTTTTTPTTPCNTATSTS